MIKISSTDAAPLQFVMSVAGIAIYLDQFAIVRLAKDQPVGCRERFVKALIRSGASLLFSGTNGVELATLTGSSAVTVRAFLSELGCHWVFVEPNPIKVMEREGLGRTADTCLSTDMMRAFFQDRKTDLSTSSAVLDMSATTFCELGTVVDWMGPHAAKLKKDADALDRAVIHIVRQIRQDYDSDPKSLDRILPPIPYEENLPATFVWNHLLRNIVTNVKGHPLKAGDGRDLCHAVVGSAYGSLAALDKHWKSRIEALPKPNGVAKIYYAPELVQLVTDLEAYAASIAMGPD